MRKERLVFGGFLALGSVMWILDALGGMVDSSGESFFRELAGGASEHDLFIRIFGMAVIVVTGLIMGRLIRNADAARTRATHLNAILSAIRGVNQIITRENDRDTLLTRICEIIVESGVYPAAIIMLPRQNSGRREFDAGLGDRGATLREIIERDEDPLCFRRVIERSVAVNIDHSKNPDCCARGFSSGESVCVGIRLEYGGTVYGTLMLPSVTAFVLAEEETLLEEVAGDIAFALYMIEERKRGIRVERVARENEDRYRLLFEQARDALSISSREGTFSEVNPAFLDMFGYTREELDGMTTSDLYINLPDRHEVMEALDAQGYCGDHEALFRRKDGTVFPCLVNIVLLRDAENTVIGLQSSLRDISVSKRFVESLAQYRRAIEASEDAIFCMDRNYRFVFANAAYLDLRKRPQEEMIGHTFREIIEEDFYEGTIKPYYDRCLAGETVRFEVEREFPVGRRCLEVGYFPLRDDTGEVGGVVALHRDITAVRDAERVAREREDRYRLLFEQSHDAISITSPEGRYIDVNHAWLDMFGYTPEDVPTLTTDMTYADASVRIPVLHALETQGYLPEHEVQYRRKDGVALPCRMNITVLRDAENNVFGFQASLHDISESNRFMESLAQYRRAIEASEDAISCMDRDGRFIFTNTAYMNLRNLSREEMIGHTFREIIGDDFYEGTIRPYFERCLAGETVRFAVEREYPVGWRCIDVGYFPLRDDRGEITGVVSVNRDITAIRDAENILRLERDKLKSILDSMRDGIYIIDTDCAIQYANPALERQFGSWEGRKCHQYLAGLDTVCPWCPREEVFAGKTVTAEWSPEGAEKYYIVSSMPVYNVDGSVSDLAVIHDVTARKRSEDEVRSMAKFPLEAPWPVIRVSRDGVLRFVNPAAERAFQLHTHAVGEMVPEFAMKAIQTACETGETHEAEVEEGDRVFLSVVVPVENTDYVNVYSSDITLHRQLQVQYLQAQKMETVARLAGGVAHDFNNLLTAILGYADMAAAGIPEESVAYDDVREIRRIALRAADLTRQLLAFSRRQIIAPRVLTLNDTLLEMDKMLRRLIGEDIELVTLADPNLRPVRMDPSQLEQILTNLVVNASDAMPGGGKLTIETGTVTLDAGYAVRHDAVEPGEYVMMAVSDTGSGMPDEVKAHAFEPFFTTKDIGKGTGLGLATVYGIVKQNSGHIWLYSEAGQGTTVKIYFPAVPGPVECPLSEAAGIAPVGTETILFVEDEPALLSMATRTLRDLGYTVIEATNGEEGLRVAEGYGGEIDLILTDVVMPRMGGKELAEKLRASRPAVRALFVSGYTDNSIAHHGILESGIAFLQKPFSKDSLARRVRDVLDE